MTKTTRLDLPTADLLSGEAVCWDTPEGLVPVGRIRQALADAGLPETALRAMLKRNAFIRALAVFKASRLVRQVADTADALTFQLTREEKAGDTLEYTFDDRLRLDKLTGAITAADPELAARAQEMVVRADGGRTGGTSPAWCASCSRPAATCSRSAAGAGSTTCRRPTPGSSRRRSGSWRPSAGA